MSDVEPYDVENPDSPWYGYTVTESDPTTEGHTMTSATDEVEATPVTSQRVDVSAVLSSVIQGEALRDAIKTMQNELKIHEDNIKDALGEAIVGTDSTGKTVVRYPHRSRSGLDKAKVKDRMDPADYVECETVTGYRTLLYGED